MHQIIGSSEENDLTWNIRKIKFMAVTKSQQRQQEQIRNILLMTVVSIQKKYEQLFGMPEI